tara:strand:+ start:537 stop:1544 length:1008 start_codon:yes stop_codon:yes gene_type:complete
MEIINNYEELDKKYNLLYLAKPVYGGWVTFTAHLSRMKEYPIYKITKRSEKSQRDYGYGCKYQNLCLDDILKLDNILITAVDKNYWEYLRYLPKDTKIIIHDPTECKISKSGNPLVQKVEDNEPLLSEFKIITIRETVQKYLKDNFNYESLLINHPFYEYEKQDLGIKYRCVSVARIDFDKNTDIILKANKMINKKKDHIYLFGAENRIYVHHKLKELGIETYWKGKFPKNMEPTYEEKSILRDAKYMIDMSIIKGDGGGTQYTFLEAIYQDCILILHNEWINKGNLFQSGVNCIGVSNEEELSQVINNDIGIELEELIRANSKKILKNHIKIEL